MPCTYYLLTVGCVGLSDSVATSQLCETTVQLCEAIDRSSVQELEDFNLLCLKDMSAAIGSRLGAEFTVDCVLPRNKSSAKKNNGVDLRSRVLWSFVESWSLQAVGGMKAVAAAVGLNKDALGRYHRNHSSKGSTLSAGSCASAELAIIRHLLPDPQAQARADTSAKQVGKTHTANQPRVVPLHFHSVDGGGFTAIYSLGEAVDQSDWMLCPQRSGLEIPLRRGMKGRKLFCKGDLIGRSFEWCIVEDTHPFRAGRPKFILKELIQDPSTGLLMPSSDRWYGSGPQEMWSDLMQKELGPSKRCRSGLNGVGSITQGSCNP